jgi:hypothetical protein
VDKVEPKSAFKEEFSPDSSPAASPKMEPETKVDAKSLEIDQPESEDEEPVPAAAPPAKEEKPQATTISAPASNGVAAVSFVYLLPQQSTCRADQTALEPATRQEAF